MVSPSPETIICKLFSSNNRGRVERHYVRLSPGRSCVVCKAEVVVPKEIWRRLRNGDVLVFECEQCSLLD